MTTRKSGTRRSGLFSASDRLRARRRRQDRKGLLETLEQRQLLAGPDLIAIQPNEGSLLFEDSRLTVAPRELVFQFDDATEIDPETLAAIQITRAGGDDQFESAETTTDFGTGGSVLVNFRAVPSGAEGNGIALEFSTANRVGSSLPTILVEGKTISVGLNSNPASPTTVAGLLSALTSNPQSAALVTGIQLTGASLTPIGTTAPDASRVELAGANAAAAFTDLGTSNAVRVRVLSTSTGPEGRGQQLIVEQRNFLGPALPAVIVRGNDVTVQVNSAPGNETTVGQFLNAINSNPQASALMQVELQAGLPSTLVGNRVPTYSPLVLSGASDVQVVPGYVGLGDSARQVVFRFTEPLPDDKYQISVFGEGPVTLQNIDGEVFNDGANFVLPFELDLGPQVLAVVPEPVRRLSNGTLSPEVGVIEVHFNDDELEATKAEDPSFYRLFYSRGTANNNDDVMVTPTSVSYSAITNVATLQFASPLARVPDPDNPSVFLTDGARLRIGQQDAGPSVGSAIVPTEIAISVADPADSFAGIGEQIDFTATGKQAAVLSSEIFNVTPYGLDLPGGSGVPGVQSIREEDPTRLDRVVPLDILRRGADRFDGISTLFYDFAPTFLGDDPNSPGLDDDKTYFNVITEEQKERVRESLELFSQYLGIQFVETNGAPAGDAFFTIAVGDIYGADPNATSGPGGLAVATADRNLDGLDDLAVLDFQDFDSSTDDQFGGPFFRGSMLAVGQMLGLGFADGLPGSVTQSADAIFNPGNSSEQAFPSAVDIVNGQFLYRPESTDIDLYRFELPIGGKVSVQTIAERMPEASLLDTALRLYKQLPDGKFEEIAANDDYFSKDSLIELELSQGVYVFGVSASGNDAYDPAISGTGFGGRTEGAYDLRIDFEPISSSLAGKLTDLGGVALDGDGDGRPGGVHNFWFVPADPTATLFVDKMANGTGNGSINSPFRDLDDAISRAQPGQTIRVVANGGADGLVHTQQDNRSYQVGVDSFGSPLQDGSTLDIPQGVTLVVDAGVIFKMKNARVGVGSTAPTINRSGASLQLLGTPNLLDATGQPVRDSEGVLIPGSVIFTSINDDSVGSGNTPIFTPEARSGDWGGLDFRGDLDAADESRVNLEDQGLFINHLQFADLRYGGGRVSVDGRSVVVSPVDMAITRATVAHSTIRDSADAAIAATPDTFAVTRFDEAKYQEAAPFVPDYARVGPDVYGNSIIDNSINGMFIRVVTRSGSNLQPLTTQARFDDVDVPHILTENLVIQGSPGGPLADSNVPSVLLVDLQRGTGTEVAAGTYAYRLTNVDASGQEGAASTRTNTVTLATDGAVRLSQLPTVPAGGEFVARRLYRAAVTIDPVTGLAVTGPFQLVAQLNASSRTFTDNNGNPGATLPERAIALRARLDGRLDIDPGTVIKLDSARIEARFGGDLIAEGEAGLPIIFTSLEDQRYGGSGTFDTNNRGEDFEVTPGDWGGLYFGQGSSLSLDYAVIAGAGGDTRIEGGFATFNPIEVHQADLRLTNSKFEFNADGQDDVSGDRVGRSTNAPGTVFVRGATPIIVNNQFLGGEGAAITIDINSLSFHSVEDKGRSTGPLNLVEAFGNAGPMVRENRLDDNDINGMQVRGGELATQGVWDDYDIVHVVNDTIEIPNQFVYGGLQLKSDARGSLVVKFENSDEPAGLVVGGNLLTAAEQLRGINDRIGGSLQLVGHPDFPVILTTLADDFSGAGFTPDGRPQLDTNNDGLLGGDLSDQSTGAPRLPTGPEVNNGTLIDNDVDINTPGFFSAQIVDGGSVQFFGSGVTVFDATLQQLLINQDYIFAYDTYVVVNGQATALAATTVTQPATLIADDRVESRGTFQGPAGVVNWTIQSYFLDGVATLFSTLDLESPTGALGDIQVVNYLDEDVEAPSDDILYTTGSPGQADFRAFTIDGARRVGFAHGGFYSNDGVNQTGAEFDGWAADQFPELEAAILAGTATFSVAGDIDTVDLPQGLDPGLGTTFGPADVTTAFAWSTDAAASNSRITAFLELIPEDPATTSPLQQVTAGLWNGVTVREAASDRNVAAIAENESVLAVSPGTNGLPSQAQFLGELAPSGAGGDENRRLGFVVDGLVGQRDDVDVYSFVAEAGTQVWFDIDATSNSLDTVLELIDANGQVLALSDSSLREEADPSRLYVSDRLDADSVRPMSEIGERTETQVLTISGNIQDANGFLTLGLSGQATTAEVRVSDFLANPSGSVQLAVNTTFGDTLGPVEVTLARRVARQFDPADSSVVTEPGGDYVLALRFDNDLYLGSDVPNLLVDTSLLDVSASGPVTFSLVEQVDNNQLQDLYSTNPNDPGMRIVMPGETGTRNLYHVRVRSSNAATPTESPNLLDPAQVRDGLTRGSYRLQVRLREADEAPGTQVRFTDIRYATTGLQIIGQPFHSPLLGEEYEQAAPNDAFGQAQPLGPFGVDADGVSTGNNGPLSSDRLAKSVAGVLDGADDIDWYQFDVQYDRLTRDDADLYLATIFDLDYADNFARADMAFYVFDAAGNLVMTAGDSNIADDQPRSGQGVDSTDLSRGSAGTLDPFLGTTELSEGTYFVAVANQTRIPEQMDQFFVSAAANPLLRLEPIDSVVRIAEDRIGSSGGGTAADPVVPVLFDPVSAPIDLTLNDVVLYTIGRTFNGNEQSVNMVNPFTGENFGSVGLNNQDFADFAFLPNGELFSYNRDLINGNPPNDTGVQYQRISSETGAATVIGASNLQTFEVAFTPDGPAVVASDEGVHPEAITFRDNGLGFFVGNRVFAPGPEYLENIVYQFDPQTGQAFSGAVGNRVVRTINVGGQAITIDERANGAGTQIRERGHIETGLFDTLGNPIDPNTARRTQFVVSEATDVDVNGATTPILSDGLSTFTIFSSNQTPFTFEMDSGPEFTFQYDDERGFAVRDGDQFSVSTLSGTTTYEFNTGPVLTVDPALLVDGATVTLTDAAGVTRTFEFDSNGVVPNGSIAVPLLDLTGARLTDAELLDGFAGIVSRADFQIVAGATTSLGRINLSNDSELNLPVVTGGGLGVEGDFAVTPGLENNQIRINENATRESFAAAVAEAVGGGVIVGSAGDRINFRGATAVDTSTLQIRGVVTGQTGTAGVSVPGRIAVPFSVADRDVDIAIRVAEAINNANLGTITAAASGRTVTLSNAAATRDSLGQAFEVLGVTPGGRITGIAFAGQTMFAVSNAGGLYAVDNPTQHFEGNIGRYISTATDLVGIPFTGLVSGPDNVDGGRYADLLFGTTADGRVYAFNTAGELQPIFAGGRTNINVGGNGSVRGLAFSTLDYNLWHVTGTRGEDAGHGINEHFNGTRDASAGGSSFRFGFENSAFGGLTTQANSPTAVPRQDGQAVENTFNFPGGAFGAIESNPFGLGGYSAADQPYLYFNYFLESDDGTDAFRVYVTTDDGVEHLVTTNGSARGLEDNDDQFDDPNPDDDIDVDVQEAFDNTDTWRQARVPLGEFAGRDNLRLRVEFSSAGQIGGGDPAIRALPGSELRDGQEIAISGQTFNLQFGPTIVTPPGSRIADFYRDADAGVPGSAPDERVTLNVGGVTFVLNDGQRNVDVAAGEVNVPLFDPAVVGAVSLDQLSASAVADILAPVIRDNAPQAQVDNAFDFTAEPNDELRLATPLPTSAGDLQLSGNGNIESARDVDLFRIDLPVGATLDIAASPSVGSAMTPVARLFDANGNELARGGVFGLQRTATTAETLYLGISSNINSGYNPIVAGSGVDGDIGGYTASISVTRDFRVIQSGTRVEVTGGFPVTLPAGSPLVIDQSAVRNGLSIAVDSGMTAVEVAGAIRQAMAQQFANGQMTAFGTSGSQVNFVGLSIDDAGPFGLAGNGYGNQFGSEGPDRARDNAFEGVYFDDIIIGFAERGELVTGATANTDLIVDPSPNLTSPPQPVSSLSTGSYQLEIRDASEFVASLPGETFRAFDTNTRLAQSQTITARPADQLIDGTTFTIGDGNTTVTFEFDLVESNTGVQSGRVRIPYTFNAIDPGSEQISVVTGLPIPGTGLVRPQTAGEVAEAIVAAINSSEVQLVLNVSAQPSSGAGTRSDSRINLLGTSLVDNGRGALANVERAGGRGDANRDHDSQGVIMVENSRFLLNSQYGIDLVHDVTADVAGVTTDSLVRYPRNLVELNTNGLVPGVVVQSNVLAFNSTGGIRVSGIAADGSALPPVPFDRILNNTIIGGTITAGATAPAETLQGIQFPQGALSFADRVVDYNPGAGGGPVPDTEFQDTTTALGAPDSSGLGAEPVNGDQTLSMGNGGILVLEFVDNRLTGSGDARPDLVVFEAGAVESVLVEISRDGVTYFEVGTVDGLSNLIDIDAAGFGTQDRFAFVRLTDLRQGDPTSSTIGADIDAVGAISSTTVDLFVAGGTGITVRQNASPTMLNNIVANSELGIDVDATSSSSVQGALTFYRNTTSVGPTTSLGTFPQLVSDSDELFVGAGELIFTPSSGAAIIDSSIDSLEDRASLVTIRSPLGLPRSPIIAPRFDVNGQLRVDDPNVESPFGSGELVFKDRGAEDRGDQVGPRAILISPRADELGAFSGVVEVTGQAPSFFDIQLIDGIAPSDPVPGVGIDDRSVSGDSVLLLENGLPLVQGVDYNFGYNPSTNVIRLTSLAGVFKSDAVYVVRLLDATDAVIRALPATDTTDGGIFNIVDLGGNTTSFEYESSITVSVPETLPQIVGADEATFSITDGRLLLTFELDDNQLTATDVVPVAIPLNATAEEIAAAITTVINLSALELTATDVGNGQFVLTGTNTLSAVDPLLSGLVVQGAIGTSIGFGIGIPANVAVPDGLEDGQTFVIRRGSVQEMTFELDTDNQVLTPGALPVTITENSTIDEVADALVRAISGAGLGLSPINAGGGRVALRSDVTYTLDMTSSVLTQLGQPGQEAPLPVALPAGATAEEAAIAIAEAINAANLPSVTASLVGNRIFLDGTAGVTGAGVLDLVTIQDEIGNLLQSNQPNGRTELTIFVGTGFDFGDAPDPYASSIADGGPRRRVDNSLFLGAGVTADSDARVPDGDVDDGVSFLGSIQRGFTTTVDVDVNSGGQPYRLDILVDWNGDGDFSDAGESRVLGSPGNPQGLEPFLGSVALDVPQDADLGTTYARVILTGMDTAGQLLETGEIEDLPIVVQSNAFQNPLPGLQEDVNNSGVVTPLDALQVINALNRAGSAVIQLSPPPTTSLPEYPDVDGDGRVTASDALAVIFRLNRDLRAGIRNAQGEALVSSFVGDSSGVLASVPTFVSPSSSSSSPQGSQEKEETFAGNAKVNGYERSVFESAPAIGMEDLLDTLVEDQTSASSEESALDQIFSGLGR